MDIVTAVAEIDGSNVRVKAYRIGISEQLRAYPHMVLFNDVLQILFVEAIGKELPAAAMPLKIQAHAIKVEEVGHISKEMPVGICGSLHRFFLVMKENSLHAVHLSDKMETNGNPTFAVGTYSHTFGKDLVRSVMLFLNRVWESLSSFYVW